MASLQDPDHEPQRMLAAATKAFDKHHALAPDAQRARFTLRLRDPSSEGGPMDFKVHVDGDAVAIEQAALAVGAIPPPFDEAAEFRYAGEALRAKRHAHAYSWRAEVRSPGLPENVQRLGDLRLGCRVNAAMAREAVGFWLDLVLDVVTLGKDLCTNQPAFGQVAAARPLVGATLVEGDRRVPLAVSRYGQTYSAPVNDPSYPDDALIELEFAASPSVPALPAACVRRQDDDQPASGSATCE